MCHSSCQGKTSLNGPLRIEYEEIIVSSTHGFWDAALEVRGSVPEGDRSLSEET